MAPAMNTNMWEHPAVAANVATLAARGVRFVDPGYGYLACGWVGKGRLAEPLTHCRGGRTRRWRPAHVTGRAAGARDRGADARGPRSRAVSRQPIERPHGLCDRARGGQARRRRVAGRGADVARPARRRRVRARAERARHARGRAGREPGGPTWSSWPRPSRTSRRGRARPARRSRRVTASRSSSSGPPTSWRTSGARRGSGRPAGARGIRRPDRRSGAARAPEARREARRRDRGQRRDGARRGLRRGDQSGHARDRRRRRALAAHAEGDVAAAILDRVEQLLLAGPTAGLTPSPASAR